MKFYEDPIYLKMCEKAEELQELFVEDSLLGEGKHLFVACKKCKKILTEDNGYYYDNCGDKDFVVFRQDQLQEILNIDSWEWFELCYNMAMLQTETKPVLAEIIAIQVVMEQKFNKTWNGEDWK